jgi:MinD-like ATPase involved in chromosome partitioning or flagellar assembly
VAAASVLGISSSDPAVMAQMTPELYGELLAFLRGFYEVILLDLGTGVTAPIATFAVDHADQVVVVTTPEWITNTKVQMALSHLRLEHATLVLNKVDGRAGQRATERQFSRDRIAQRVAVPADLQLKTMLYSARSRCPASGAPRDARRASYMVRDTKSQTSAVHAPRRVEEDAAVGGHGFEIAEQMLHDDEPLTSGCVPWLTCASC